MRGVLAVVFSLLAGPALAQASAQTAAPPAKHSKVGTTISFLAGAATGLAVHESGHVLFGAVFGASPRVRPLHYGLIPFFKIDHNPVSRRKEFVISSAGLWMQHADAEWILTARPDLRREHAPFLKGILAFDLATSTMYSVAAFGRWGPPERDTRGIAVSLGKTGAPEPLVGALVLAPAVLDGYRYLRPDATWAKWASRVVKIAAVALTLAPGR